MRADAFLAAAETLAFAGLDEIAKGRGVVIVAPHPDDESLGCGGLIAQACRRRLPLRLVVVSDGTGSHPNSPSYPAERLRALREAETLDAARALGLGTDAVEFLRLPDRAVPGRGAPAERAADRIAAIVRDIDAGTMLVTWACDPHCDHRACAAIARLTRARAPDLRLLEYPIWGWSLAPETDVGAAPIGFRLDICDDVDAKRAAVEAHRSQTTDLIGDDPGGFRLHADMIARFMRPFEIYLDVAR